VGNPTGSVYLTAAPGYVWTDGDVYEILQGDQQEGAGTGASFGGIGVDNQPHQILLNKIQLTHVNQLAAEANITSLLAFMAKFVGSITGANGYLEIPFSDIIRGASNLIAQWVTYSIDGQNWRNLNNSAFTVSWPIAFPNACKWATTWWVTNDTTSAALAMVQGIWALETGPLSKTGGTFCIDWNDGGHINVSNAATGAQGLSAVGILAVGY
jgi:hypothetical protein